MPSEPTELERLRSAMVDLRRAMGQILDALEHEDSGKEPDDATDPMLGIARAAIAQARWEEE